QVLFATALGVILGIFNVFFRDVGQMTGIVLQFWFWFTPIIYPPSILPEGAAQLLELNPMLPIVQAYQGIFVEAAWPQWHTLWPMALVSLVLSLMALSLFRKRAGQMVDDVGWAASRCPDWARPTDNHPPAGPDWPNGCFPGATRGNRSTGCYTTSTPGAIRGRPSESSGTTVQA